MILYFLRLFSTFKDLEALTRMQAEAAEKHSAVVAAITADRDRWRHDCIEEGNRRSELKATIRDIETDLTNCREALDAASNDRISLQDRLESALSDKDKLWGSMQDALNNERFALRSQINHANQKAGAGIPYPDAHSLPPAAVMKPQEGGPIGRKGRILPSEAIAKHDREFIKEFVLSREPKPATP